MAGAITDGTQLSSVAKSSSCNGNADETEGTAFGSTSDN